VKDLERRVEKLEGESGAQSGRLWIVFEDDPEPADLGPHDSLHRIVFVEPRKNPARPDMGARTSELMAGDPR
jgi:hypothetical protein